MNVRIAAWILVAPLLSSPAVAKDNAPRQANFQEQKEICGALAGLAKQVMIGRQTGTSMADFMKSIEGAKEPFQKMALGIAEGAWQQPAYTTPEAQSRAVTEFENQTYLGCMKGWREAK